MRMCWHELMSDVTTWDEDGLRPDSRLPLMRSVCPLEAVISANMFAAPAVIIKQMLVCVIQPPSLHGILNHFRFGEEIIFLYVQ